MSEYISLDIWKYNFDANMEFISNHISNVQYLYIAMVCYKLNFFFNNAW